MKVLILGNPCDLVQEICLQVNADYEQVRNIKKLQQLSDIVHSWSPGLLIVSDEFPDALSETGPVKALQIPKLLIMQTNRLGSRTDPAIPDFYDDVIFTPIHPAELLYRMRQLFGKFDDFDRDNIRKNVLQKMGMKDIVGRDRVFLDAVAKIQLVADCDASVLITGETGVGKEVCARAIHYMSKRSDKPFIPVECGSIPANLLESELFGHRRGAFTDARTDQLGIVHEAEGGTLFLDEFDSMGMEGQAKLLRLLEERTYRPLGYARYLQADIRIVAATNANLAQRIREGKFRQDLYYRLNVTVDVPPLRKRKSDITLLAETFLQQCSKRFEKGEKKLSRIAVQKLLMYEWPGNVRELQNVVQQAYLLSPSAKIGPEDISFQQEQPSADLQALNFKEAKQKAVEQFEVDYLTQLLMMFNGNITQASAEAQKDRRDLGRMIKKYRIDLDAYRYQTS